MGNIAFETRKIPGSAWCGGSQWRVLSFFPDVSPFGFNTTIVVMYIFSIKNGTPSACDGLNIHRRHRRVKLKYNKNSSFFLKNIPPTDLRRFRHDFPPEERTQKNRRPATKAGDADFLLLRYGLTPRRARSKGSARRYPAAVRRSACPRTPASSRVPAPRRAPRPS